MPTTLTLITPSGQVAQELTVPTQWADVTLAQYVARFAPEVGDTRRPAEVLLGLPAGGLDDLAANDVQYLSNLLAFAAEPTDVQALLPTPGLPDIGTMPYGILLEAQRHVQEYEGRHSLSYGPYLLALYRVQMTYGRYDGAKVAACEAALLASPVTEVAADAAFFLNSYEAYQNATHQTPTTTPSPMTTKKKLAQTGWLKGLGLYLGWTWPQGEAS